MYLDYAHVWALAQSGGHKERSRLGQGCNDPASAKVPDFFGGRHRRARDLAHGWLSRLPPASGA